MKLVNFNFSNSTVAFELAFKLAGYAVGGFSEIERVNLVTSVLEMIGAAKEDISEESMVTINKSFIPHVKIPQNTKVKYTSSLNKASVSCNISQHWERC